MHHDKRVAALKRVAILAGLPDRVIARIVATCSWRRYDAGEPIVSYLDASSDVFFLAGGRARVIIYSRDGRAVIFTDLKASDMFGELAAIDHNPRSASVEALEPCMVASLTSGQFERLMIEEPRVAVATLRIVAAEVRRLSDRVLEFSTLAVQNRIHAELLRLATAAGHTEGEVLIVPAPSLAEIANRVSTHREAVSRELARLARIGLARREKRGLRITDVGRLALLVHEANGQ